MTKRFSVDELQIRFLETPAEMHQVEDLQRLIWQGGDLDVVPAHFLQALAHGGSPVFGAFVGDDLVGFTYGFLGTDLQSGALKYCSHQLGVHPEYQSLNINFNLKRAQ